jgi:hypothetical protein
MKIKKSMKAKRWAAILAGIGLGLAAVGPARAQYYTEGQDPYSIRWRQMENDRYRIVYPALNEVDALRVGAVLDTVFEPIHYGLSLRARRLPIVLHGQNLYSNGVVTWAPRRSELILTPPTDIYATPWLKQLTVHEYRHVVQIGNLDRHFIRALGWLGGEQVTGAASAFLPKWFFEGDAVLAETQTSAFGRALQPEFTLAYRALLDGADINQFVYDKWLCGSLRDYIPDQYQLGYQLVNWTYKQHGPEYWERIYDYTTRHPYLIFPRQIAAKKFYRTSTYRLIRETFTDLKRYWDSQPRTEDSAAPIETPYTAYTTYSHPVPIDRERTVALKSDLDRPERLVLVDTTGAERVLAYTGNVSSRPVHVRGELLWTEYQTSPLWEQKSRSVIRRMALDGSRRAKTTVHPEGRSWFYITPFEEGFAAVSYDPLNKYAVERLDTALQPVRRYPIPDGTSIHGLAWDSASGTLALITLTEEGMALTGLDPAAESLFPITRPSFVTINHLRAEEGSLFFNSIASGKDEAHRFDLRTGRQFRITDSRYGSVMPAAVPGTGRLVAATYRREGYFLSTQTLDTKPENEVFYRRLPVDLLNAPQYDPGLPLLDTIPLLSQEALTPRPSKPYRKGAHLLGVHSWMPAGFDVFNVIDERNIDLNLGATVLSQNTLSNTESYLTYGRVDGRNWWKGGLRLMLFAPTVDLSLEYDGGDQLVYAPAGLDPKQLPDPGPREKFLAIDGKVSLPINLSSGRMLRSLTPAVRLTHYNTQYYRPQTDRFAEGYEKGELSLSYAQNVRTVARDLAPRWGFGVMGSWAGSPTRKDFGRVWSLYGNLYVPGLARHHSLRLRGAVQAQEAGMYNFASNVLFPRGAAYNFAPKRLGAVLADYRFPVAYPDWGIPEVLYVRRISANLFGGWSRYQPIGTTSYRNARSYGTEITLDTNPLASHYGMSFRFALYKVGGQKDLFTGIGVSFEL